MIYAEAWYREVTSSKEDILQYLSDLIPYEQLPPHYQASIREYTSEGFPEDGDFAPHVAKYLFRIGNVPTEVMVREIERVQGGRGEISRDFDEYHKEYVGMGLMPDHGPKNRWPVSLSQYYEDEVLEDGWHRFHDYYRKGHKTIPVVEWVRGIR